MNMFLQELKTYRKSTIIWTASLIGILITVLAMFPSFAQEAEEFKKLLEGFPEVVRNAIGLQVDTIGSILGYYSYIFTYVLLCGAIQAMNLGTSLLSREVREKTADFLLTKPVTRVEIITSKILAALTSLLITNIVYLASAYIMASIVKTEDFSIKVFLMISITLFFIQLIFLALGLILSVVLKKIKSVLPLSLGTVLGFFIAGMLASTTGDDKMRYLTPFKYFDTNYIMQNSAYEGSYIIIGLIFVLGAISATYYIYSKKDIHTL